jgi:hypothetical protein
VASTVVGAASERSQEIQRVRLFWRNAAMNIVA